MQINLKDSTGQTFVEQAAPKAKLVTTKFYDEAVEYLFNSKINALVADYPFCAFTAFRYNDKGLTAGRRGSLMLRRLLRPD